MDLPVRIFWKADSTLDASKAEVSIKVNPFWAKGSVFDPHP